MTRERWQPLAGYVGHYEVSDQGRVRRITPGPGARVNHVLQPYVTRNGYETVRPCRDGVKGRISVHRAVLEAFRGTVPNLPECNHKDGNKRNNCLSNLEWVTSSTNKQHAVAKGLACVGERHYQHKLRASDIPVIRGLYGRELQRVTARRYGVSQSLIGLVQTGKVWKHVA